MTESNKRTPSMEPALVSDSATFRDLANRAELGSLTAVKMSVDATSVSAIEDARVNVNLKDRARGELSADRAALTVDVDFEVELQDEADAQRKFTATITYRLKYSFREPLEADPKIDEALAVFCRNNPRYNAWPFLREFVNYTMTYAGLPGFVLPLLRPFAQVSADA